MGSCGSTNKVIRTNNVNFRIKYDLNKHTNDVFGLLVTAFIRINTHNRLLFIPMDIQYLCLAYYRDNNLIIGTRIPKQLISTKYTSHYIFDSILLKPNSILTVNPWDKHSKYGGSLYITCYGDIVLQQSSQIRLNGKGYQGGAPWCNGHSYKHDSPSQKTWRHNYGGGGGAIIDPSKYATSKYGGGGAGHGTIGTSGGYGGVRNAGITYGNPQLTVLHLGSGGGGGTDDYGGNGGGAVKIKCYGSIIMHEKAKITCNGMGTYPKNKNRTNVYYKKPGCGSGGSIHIIIKHYTNLQMGRGSKIECIGGHYRYPGGIGEPYLSRFNKGGNGRIRIQSITQCEHVQKLKYFSLCDITPRPYVG